VPTEASPLRDVDDTFSDSDVSVAETRAASSPTSSPGPAANSPAVSSPPNSPAAPPARDPAPPSSPASSPAALVPSDHALLTQVPRTQPAPQAAPPLPRKRAREHPPRFRGVEAPPPPSPAALVDAFAQASLPQVDYPDPHYDSAADRPARPLVFANRKIVVPCELAEAPPPWTAPYVVSGEMRAHIEADLRDRRVRVELFKTKRVRRPPAPTQWRYVVLPPSPQLVALWAAEEPRRRAKAAAFVSQLERFTATNDFKFSNRPDKVARKPDGFSHLTTFNLEVHPLTRGELAPDPSRDAVGLVVYCFDDPNAGLQRRGCLRGDAALDEVVRLVRYCDPDILCGYEVNAASWGYLVARARHLGRNLCHELSRSDFKSNGKVGDRWGYTHTSNVEVPGRHMLNVWRVLRSELSLTSYSLEHVAYHLLHQVVPRFGVGELTEWLTGTAEGEGAGPEGEDVAGAGAEGEDVDGAGAEGEDVDGAGAEGVPPTGVATASSAAPDASGALGPLASAVTTYYLKRLDLTAQLMAAQEIILRYSEQSRLIGVDFYSNFYRGLQYKVELLLLRLAKAQNVLLNSPSKDHVHNMRLLECIPLVMEPALGFYKLPLVVVDFQALYPSIIIAYNYCYTTMLGRLRGYDPRHNEVGYLRHVALPRGLLAALHAHNDITVSPNGVMFARLRVRKSMLAQMLEEILAARINVKRLMRMFGAHDAELRKLYDSKQMALKLIANVTYGYTSASFSGRMPNLDVADAIVATGREILTQLIGLIERHPQWGARVVYGDTDLLFVYLPGRQREEAFRIGRQIAEHVTGRFPNPVALKFEKVYHPCVLLSKKRYVGYSFELETAAAKFDAKGIETVRRDGIPAQQIVLERLLRLLFDTANLLAVKRYVVQQFGKVAAGRVSVRDFCFAKEVRLGTYKDARYMPPGAVLAQRAADHDPHAEPQYRERVPYVVVQDSLKPRLRDRCVLPQDYAAALRLATPYKLDHVYYILKMLVPPLERIFNLMGVDVRAWFREMPRAAPGTGGGAGAGGVFGAHIRAHACAVCHRQLDGGGPVCAACAADEQAVVASLCGAVRTAARQHAQTLATCRGCASAFCGPLGRALHAVLQCCDNYNCKTYYERLKATQTKARVVAATLDLLERW
jgi:DNA polymerase elongation subunit (family B)